ncbi:MAG TPA: NAD(P)H-binding protein [Bacteroidota bacterium]|nr:NAD(P)H-binding protein [Bacteroidota bacterium]
MTSSSPASAVVAGATGLVGRECVDLLLGEPGCTRIIALVRRTLHTTLESERLWIRKVDYESLDHSADLFRVDAVFCALGTTMHDAGTEEAFRRVDFDYALHVARLGLEGGARHFLLVSALGADPHSRVFYNRVKGELEHAVGELGYRSVTIVRPSLLVGERPGPRRFERLAGRLAFLSPRRIRPVEASRVAAALVSASVEDAPGQRIIENRDIP